MVNGIVSKNGDFQSPEIHKNQPLPKNLTPALGPWNLVLQPFGSCLREPAPG